MLFHSSELDILNITLLRPQKRTRNYFEHVGKVGVWTTAKGPQAVDMLQGPLRGFQETCFFVLLGMQMGWCVYSNQYATLLRGSPRFSDRSVSLVKGTWRHRLACSLSP